MIHDGILFVGDINVDLIFGGLEYPVQEDKEIMAGSFVRTMGSSSVITAVVFRSLGGEADVCGLSGNDDNGSYMLKSLDKFGIGRSLVMKDEATPTGITVNLIHGHARSQVTYPGTISKFNGPTLSKDLAKFKHVHLTGIYQQENFLPNITKTVKYIKELGVKVSLDTQWDVTEKWEYLDDIYPFLDYLFINIDEALSISKTENIDSAIQYFKGKVSCVIIKAGSEGSYLLDKEDFTIIPPFSSKVVDTTGAGDAFAGGFLYSLYNIGSNKNEAAIYGSAVAARNCEFHGGVGARSTDIDIQKKIVEGMDA